jgi:hypothetical protein
MPEINLQNIGNNITTNIELLAPYLVNGLTYVSNDPKIVPRTKDGVIKVQENKPLIIEPTRYQISNRSVLKVVDTQFKYYNFPATVDIQEIETANIDDVVVDIDPIFARYKPSENQLVSANGYFSTPTQYFPRGIELSTIEEGSIQKRANSYYITKQIKESGKDIRIRAKIKHKFDTFGDSEYPYGQFACWISHGGPNIGFEGAGGGRLRYGPFANPASVTTVPEPIVTAQQVIESAQTYAESAYAEYNQQLQNAFSVNDAIAISNLQPKVTFIQNVINLLPDDPSQIDVIPDSLLSDIQQLINQTSELTAQPFSGQRTNLSSDKQIYSTYLTDLSNAADTANIGLINGYVGAQQTRYIDFVVPNSEFEIGDYFGITADSTDEQPGVREHTIIADETYFVITDASKNVDVWNQEL